MITSRNDCGDFIIATPTKCATTTMESIAKRHVRTAGLDADQFRLMDWDSPRRQHRMALPPTVRDQGLGEMEIIHEGEDLSLGISGDEDEWGAADRFLAVRNPFTRYISMYRYLRAPQNYSQWGAREIQGIEWLGPQRAMVRMTNPKTFGEFLTWLAAQRSHLRSAQEVKRRGPLTHGRAYRSPWVWTDSLLDSLDALVCQPGESSGEVALLRMDRGEVGKSLWMLKEEYGLEALNVAEVNSNRSTWGVDGDSLASVWWADTGSCPAVLRVLDGTLCGGGRAGLRVPRACGSCPGCVIGAIEESTVLGYLA